jgi:pyrroloquinoline-quinone synthase
MRLSRSSYAEGLGALYAYEQQIPAVAKTKAEGLKKFYNAGDPKTVEYFTVHAEIDVHHAAATQKLIDELPQSDRSKALRAAHEVSEALWRFLDGMEAERAAVH